MYSGSQIYRYQTIYPRLLRFKASSNLRKSPGCSNSPPTGHHSRLASSWRDSDHGKSRDDHERAKDEWEKNFKEQARQMKKEYIFFTKLLRDDRERGLEALQRWVERDPYRAFFGLQGERAWNPWTDSWSVFMRFGRPRKVDKTENKTPSTSSDKKDTQAQSSEEHAKSIEESTTVEKTKEEKNLKSFLISENEQYTIDPITMKKVPKSEPVITQQAPISKPVSSTSVETDIPVKKFEPADPENQTGNHGDSTFSKPAQVDGDKLAGFAAQPWLVREGFTPESSSPDMNDNSPKHPTSTSQISGNAKIQSALDRQIFWGDKKIPRAERPKYIVPENKTEDLDLLRASDVRAASGRRTRKETASAADLKRRREKLEKKFTETEEKFTSEVQSVRDAQRQLASTQTQPSSLENIRNNPGTNERLHQTQRDHWNHIFNQSILHDQRLGQHLAKGNGRPGEAHRKAKLESALEKLNAEINHTKDAYEKSENEAKGQSKLENKAIQPAVSLKGDANPALIAASIDAILSAKRKEREKALVREIRHIYEDKYGTIDTTHKQPILEEPPEQIVESIPDSNSFIPHQIRPFVDNQSGDTLLRRENNIMRELGTPENQEQELTSEAMTPVVQDWPQRLDSESSNDSSLSTPLARDQKSSKDEMKAPKKEAPASQAPPLQKPDLPLTTGPKGTEPSPKSDKVLANTEARKAISYIYRILVLDREKQVVVAANTTSSLLQTSSPLRSASDILIHLDHPSKYFGHMSILESQGFELMAGTRGMLVYRKELKETEPAGSKLLDEKTTKAQNQSSSKSMSEEPEEINEFEQLARSLKPYRQEPQFSGTPSPKEKFVRAYDRAKQLNSVAEDRIAQQNKLGEAIHDLNSNKHSVKRTWTRRPVQRLEGRFGRAFRKFFQQLGTVSAVLILLYFAGLWADHKAKEKERAEQEERERRRKLKESSWLGY